MKSMELNCVSNLTEFSRLILEKLAGGDSPRWYRGCGKASYELTPTLYRHPKYSTVEDLMKLEAEIVDRFKERSVPFLTRDSLNEWDSLFLMQHYGVPTRLLDWTENPFHALLFALISADFKVNGGEVIYLDDASVWILDPVGWNRWALSHNTFERTILSVGDKNLTWYAPKPNDLDILPNEPLAIYGTHNSPRIVAQRGVFIIFGKSTIPMENKDIPNGTLSRVIILSQHISTLLLN